MIGESKRKPIWIGGVSVGGAGSVEKIKRMVLSRGETEVIAAGQGVSVLHGG